ncbi:MAG: hypothetical protein ABL936_18670 [Aestuariivirga sp.]
MKKALAGLSLAVAMTVFAALPASAATIDFGSGAGDDPYVEDGFSFNPSRIVNGNCGIDNPCLALNDNETTVMTYISGLFNLLSLNFNMLGDGGGNTLTVFETGNIANTISFSVPTFSKNDYHFWDFGTQFLSVSSITFATTDGGNVRIDDMAATEKLRGNPVGPRPAALPLLLGGLGGLAWLGRFRKRSGPPVA